MTISPGPSSLKTHRMVGRRLRKLDREMARALEAISAHFGSKMTRPLVDAQRNIERTRQMLEIELYRGYPIGEHGDLSCIYFGD